MTTGGEDPGRVVGGVYAANTLGAIVGALGVSLVLVPWIGTQNTQRTLLVISALGAVFVLLPRAKEIVVASLILAGVLALGDRSRARSVDRLRPPHAQLHE